MALRGAEILIYPTAIGWESSDTPEEQERQREAWTTVQRGHAVANGLPVVTVNRVGNESYPHLPSRTLLLSRHDTEIRPADRLQNVFLIEKEYIRQSGYT